MNPELYAALLALILTVLSGLTGLTVWLFRQAPGWIERIIERQLRYTEEQIAVNTKLTAEARDLSNGRLVAVMRERDKALKQAQLYRAIIEEANAYEEARAFINQAAEAVRRRRHDPHAAHLQRLLDGDTSS